jgi:hypothetical protein
VLGKTRGGDPICPVESVGTGCLLVADCPRAQSRAHLRLADEVLPHFVGTHDFFDQTGYAVYEQGVLQIDGRPNPAPRDIHRGAFDFGAGVDTSLWRWIGLRGEVRDFYTGSPAYNLPGLGGGQHNVVAGGGFVLKWGE